ncbi:MAG: HEAT repeat domain-containing protein [Planctomycetota bacterium]
MSKSPRRPIIAAAAGIQTILAPLGVPLAVAVAAGSAGTAFAQDTAPDRDPEALLEDFIHYVNIARYDVAADLAGELLGKAGSPSDFVDIVEGMGDLDRFESAIGRARRIPILESLAGALDQLYTAGKLERSRNPDEIAENLEMLKTGGTLARTLARDRLVAAGEYAMPQLAEAFLQGQDATLRARARGVLIDMGRQAVTPLATALASLDEQRQELAIEVLGRLGYRSAIPYLADTAQTSSAEAVRSAANTAIQALGGATSDVPGLYSELANDYFDERSELTSFPGEDYQLLWSFDPGLGLLMTPIVTDVYHEAMAMRLSEAALRQNAQLPETVSLWLASNFSREIETPEGYVNPVYADSRRDAEYFAVAAGSAASKRVLRRAIDARDEQLARRAIAAIERTAGSTTLLSAGDSGRRPLLDALQYPSRRVRYDAALAIASSQPEATFPGFERVVPTLAGMVREAGIRYAVTLVGDSAEAYTQERATLERAGYTVLPQARRSITDIAPTLAETPGIDLIVIDLPTAESALNAAEEVLADNRLGIAPIAVFVAPADEVRVSRQLSGRDNVIVRRSTISSAERRAAVETIVNDVTGGALSDDQANAYGDRALDALRDLAVAGNDVLSVSDAAAVLVLALEEATDDREVAIAEVLSHIGEQRAQSAVMDAALEASASGQRVALLGKVGDSAKRHGNLLPERQIRRLIDLASSPDTAVATAAAAVMGALELDGFQIVPLLLSDERIASSQAQSR